MRLFDVSPTQGLKHDNTNKLVGLHNSVSEKRLCLSNLVGYISHYEKSMDNIEMHVPCRQNTERQILHTDDKIGNLSKKKPIKTQEHPALALTNSQRKLDIMHLVKEGMENFRTHAAKNTHINNCKCFITYGLLHILIYIYVHNNYLKTMHDIVTKATKGNTQNLFCKCAYIEFSVWTQIFKTQLCYSEQ
jgi:hypothetical protein